MTYAPPKFWDGVYKSIRESGDLWSDRWTAPFIKALRDSDADKVLDLGCGTGAETLTLHEQGFDVTGLDYSAEAISIARSRDGSAGEFIVADMAEALPFQDAEFDAVMSNVAAHMFSDTITRSIFGEVRRITRPGGLFLFHLNSLEDRPLRAEDKGPGREIEENYILEEDGQTMHFFSMEYLSDLLSEWESVHLEPVEAFKHETDERYVHRVMSGYPEYAEEPERTALIREGMHPIKRTWRGIVVR